MSEVQGKISEINAKYKGVTDQAGKQKKQQEIMDIYKKNNVKPFAAFEQMFITLPIFLIIYRVVTIVRPLKSTILFGISIAMLIPILSDAWRGGCLRFKELNGTISASEKEELKERERLSMKYDW